MYDNADVEMEHGRYVRPLHTFPAGMHHLWSPKRSWCRGQANRWANNLLAGQF